MKISSNAAFPVKSKTGALLAAIASILLVGQGAQAGTLYWGKGGASTNPDNLWTTAANWYTDAGETVVSSSVPLITDDVFFNTTGDNALGGTISITNTIAAKSLTFNTSVATTLSQSGNRTFTLGSGGITVNSGAGNAGLGTSTNSLSVQLTDSQNWVNNSTSLLNVRSLRSADSAPGPVVLTLNAANTGNISFSLGITESATKTLGIIVDSASTGSVTMVASTYTGGTTVKRGILSSSGNVGAGAISLGVAAGADDARLNLTGAASNNVTVQTGAGLRTLSGSGSGDFQGDILLNKDVELGSLSSGSTVAYSGDISGTGNLTIKRLGAATNSTITMSGLNSYTGKTTIESATVVANTLKNEGVNSSLGASTGANSVISIGLNADSTLRYTGTGDSTDRVIEITAARTVTLEQAGTGLLEFTSNLSHAGTGARTLRLRGATVGTGEFSGVISNNGASTTSLSKLDSGTWRLSGLNSYTGGTSLGASGVIGGVLEVEVLADGGLDSSIGASSAAASNLSFGGTGTAATLRYVGTGHSTNRSFIIGGIGAVLDASGSGAVNFTATGTPSYGTSNVATSLTLTGTNTGANTYAANQNNNGSGAVSIIKEGSGTWVMTGTTGTYSGGTTVNAGTLLVNNSTGSGLGASNVTVNGGKLGGSGAFTGSVTVNSGGTLSPGASIESLATGSNTWNGGGALDLEFSTDGSTGSAGTQWDLLAITGGLDLSGASTLTPFTLNLFTMVNATTPGPLSSWDPDVTHTWAGFVTTTTGFTAFAASKFSFNVTGFQNPVTGTFSVVQNGNNLDLVYSAIPEPSTWALLAFSLTTVMVLRRRRA